MEQSKYMRKLSVIRRDYYKVYFNQHKGDSKHVYKQAAKLTSDISANPMPFVETYLQLAEDN